MRLLSSELRKKLPKTTAVQHIEQGVVRVNHTCRAMLVAAGVIGLAGCSISNGVTSLEKDDQLITRSVTKPVQPEGIASDDAEIIKTVVAESNEDKLLAWQNPETGNKGTITAIDNFIGSHGQQCKKFQTTVDTFMGISLYNGETCELRKGFWVLSWFLREDT